MRCVGRQRERISTQMLSAMSADLGQAAGQAKCSAWGCEPGWGLLDARGPSLKLWAHYPNRPSPNLASQAEQLWALSWQEPKPMDITLLGAKRFCHPPPHLTP